MSPRPESRRLMLAARRIAGQATYPGPVEGHELTEIIAEPGAGRVYEEALRPGIADVTATGRSRLDAMARWLQDVAYRDLIDAGFEGPGVWIVRRMRVRVGRFPRFGDELVLRTFCSGTGRFAAERHTSIAGDEARVETVSHWVYLDPQTLRRFCMQGDGGGLR